MHADRHMKQRYNLQCFKISLRAYSLIQFSYKKDNQNPKHCENQEMLIWFN